jgi:hypothetical protein
MVVLLVY